MYGSPERTFFTNIKPFSRDRKLILRWTRNSGLFTGVWVSAVTRCTAQGCTSLLRCSAHCEMPCFLGSSVGTQMDGGGGVPSGIFIVIQPDEEGHLDNLGRSDFRS